MLNTMCLMVWLLWPSSQQWGGLRGWCGILHRVSTSLNTNEFRSKCGELFNQAPYTSLPNERVVCTRSYLCVKRSDSNTFNRSIGKEISKEDRDVGFQRIDICMKWFNSTILTRDKSNAVAILPLVTMTARYRVQPP